MEIVSTDLKRINWVLADIHTQIQIIIAGGSLLDGETWRVVAEFAVLAPLIEHEG